MSEIVSVNEISGARTGFNEKGVAEYNRKFKVVTAGPTVGSMAVREATGVPRIYDIYATATESDSGSVCTKLSADQDDENFRLWVVSADYGSPSVDSNQSPASEPNPVLRPAVISWNFNKSQKIVWRDADGKFVQNSSGEYFDPPPIIDDSRPVLTISRNETSYSEARAIDYQDAVNSDSFMGFAPGVVKVAGISAQSQVEGSYRFWAVTYEFEFQRDGWNLQILDQGRTRIGIAGDAPADIGKRINILSGGVPVSDPQKLRDGQPIWNNNPTDAEYLTYRVYKNLPFNVLGLP